MAYATDYNINTENHNLLECAFHLYDYTYLSFFKLQMCTAGQNWLIELYNIHIDKTEAIMCR